MGQFSHSGDVTMYVDALADDPMHLGVFPRGILSQEVVEIRHFALWNKGREAMKHVRANI